MRRAAAGFAVALTLALLPAVATAAPPGSALATTGCSPIDTAPHFTGSVPTPKQVLGYRLGTREASDADIGTYWHAVDKASNRVVTGVFAHSWQKRPLRYALVGSPQTLRRLPQIRRDIALLRDPSTPSGQAQAIARTTPAILWITANVHGNEPAGGDAVLKLLYQLADRDDCVSQAILGNTLVGLIPSQNPDGRANNVRTNAYAFDMNRDWFARTQPEVAHKLDLLWKYPPQLYVDEHEEGGSGYFFPPNSDPVYSETSDIAYAEIQHLYGKANAAAFTAKGYPFETTDAGYDLFYQGYGDSVPTTEFGAAGMTYEQGVEASYPDRVQHHFVSALVSLYTGATHRQQVLMRWRRVFVQAQHQGAQCHLEPNRIYVAGDTVQRQVPDKPLCGYYLRGNGSRAQLLVRRLQLAHVQVDRLTAPVVVPDYTPYGRSSRRTTVPAGTYWVSMDQPQKHWIQAMLNEDTYVPFPYFYDISGWSNPLLANVDGGYTGSRLALQTHRVPLLAQPAPPRIAHLPRVAIIDQRPDPTYEYQTTGWLRWRLAQDWKIPYTALHPDQVTPASLKHVDVLVMPNVDAVPTYRGLGGRGRQALRAWVHDGGRLVTWQEGTLVASALGLSSVGLTRPKAVSPGALMRVDNGARTNYVLWDSYYSNQMTAGNAQVVARFPRRMFVSGYAQQAGSLAGSAVEAVDRVGRGSVTVFTIEPNFRAYTDGSAQLLFSAVLGTPTGSAALTSAARATPSVSGPQQSGSSALELGRTAAQHRAHDTAGKS